MWRNHVVDSFVNWLRNHNSSRREKDRISFHGLDLYSLNNSINAVLDYLDEVDPKFAAVARKRYGCLSPYSRDPAAYGAMSLRKGFAPCEKEVLKVLQELLKKQLEYKEIDGEDFLDAEQNAHVVTNAERYYREMFYGRDESWNLRDTHMFETLERLMKARGPDCKVIVWAHNSHIGDARYTDMGARRGELNIGQLAREHFGDSVALVGFGTHTGTVTCADEWDSPTVVKNVVPSRKDSYERMMHDTKIPSFILPLAEEDIPEDVREELMEPMRQRFIGVIYRPESELWSHYSECVLPMQYDAYVWFDETKAVQPSVKYSGEPGQDETYPFGV